MPEQRIHYTEVSTADGYQNEYYNFFYAVFAVSCLFSSLAAIERFDRLQANAPALLLNMCCYMVVSVSIAFLVSKITNKKEVLSFIGNIASLGMSFMSGIFVAVVIDRTNALREA